MIIKLKNKEVEIPVKKLSTFGKFRGLMFRRRDSSDILLFEFSKPTRTVFHSLFCFFPFYILWLDEKNNVLDSKICKPFTLKITTTKPFTKVIEIPLNNKHNKIIQSIDGERFKY